MDLLELLTKYTSLIVITSFLGMKSLKEKVKDESITDLILRITQMAIEIMDDPLLLMFGRSFQKKGWR